MSNNDKDAPESETPWQDGTGEQPLRRRSGLFEDFEDEVFEEPDRDSDATAIVTEQDPEDEEGFPDEDVPGPAWEYVENGDVDAPPRGEPEETIFHDEDLSAEAAEQDLEVEEVRELNFSLGMIVVVAVALLLLGVGGYGIIKQRAELRAEIRQLQAELATAASPAEVAASRAAAKEVTGRNRELEAELERLGRENHNLQAIVSGLESQLAAQQEAVKGAASAPPQPKPRATPSKAIPAASVSSEKNGADTSGWFVNFSSYAQRDTAETWQGKLQVDAGRVVLETGVSAGRTVYRVRVVDLEGRAAAEAVARALEKEYGLEKLWVGRTP